MHNFRDVGGYPTLDGRTVRWGRLYRSDSLGKLRGDDWERFRALGVRTVIDLRYPWEIEAKGRVPAGDGLTYHNLSIEHRSYDQAALAADVETARFLADRYAEVVADGVKELRQVLDVIAVADNAPVVFHCAAGKDRTGIVAALVLSLLGVSEADIVADFALTGLATERLVADWRSNNPGRTLLWPGFGQAPAELMRQFLDEMATRYGSVRGYAVDHLGVDDDLIEAMRAHLLTADR
nr:tyrosine-protein phosphatase [Planosporangium thailandense]